MFSVWIYQFNYWWFDIFPFIYLVINSTCASVITNVATQSTLVNVYVYICSTGGHAYNV